MVSGRVWRFALPYSLLAVCAGVAGSKLALLLPQTGDGQPDWLAALNPNLIQITIAAAIAAIAAYLYKTYARAGVSFGLARTYDHRQVVISTWRHIGLSVLWPTVAIDLLLVMLALPLVAAKLIMSFYIEPAAYQPGMTQLLITVTGNMLISYAALGLIISRLFARSALALSQVSPARAVSVGLAIYFRRFPAVVGYLILALVGLAVIGGLAYGGAAGLQLAADSYDLPAYSVTVGQWALVALAAALAFIAGTAYWLVVYRRLATLTYPSSFSGLVSGRQAGRNSWRSGNGLSLVAIMLLVAVVVATAVLRPEYLSR